MEDPPELLDPDDEFDDEELDDDEDEFDFFFFFDFFFVVVDEFADVDVPLMIASACFFNDATV